MSTVGTFNYRRPLSEVENPSRGRFTFPPCPPSPGHPSGRFCRLLAFCINLLFNFCVSDLCTRGRLSCFLDVFFCLFGVRKDFRSMANTVSHIGVNNYARVQLSMSCCGCCFSKPKAAKGVEKEASEEVSSGEQNVAAGCIICTRMSGSTYKSSSRREMVSIFPFRRSEARPPRPAVMP